jgi:hypothetical protein
MGKQKIAIDTTALAKRFENFQIKPKMDIAKMAESIGRIAERLPKAPAPVSEEMQSAVKGLAPEAKRFHGTRFSMAWLPPSLANSPCADKFGYMTPANVRAASALDANNVNIKILLGKLGDLMGDPGRENSVSDSNIPAGYTYFGQFVDHDVTLDISSSLTSPVNATTLNNMRTPALDLDSLYGRGPALDPHLYVFPSGGAGLPATAIKMQLGTNRNTGVGGPGGSAGFAGMQVQTDYDVPRMLSGNTAIIGDPRNDENLIVSQFHHTMLKFHNEVVERISDAVELGVVDPNIDVFVEAKKIVTHHYQWAIVKDFLPRICGTTAVNVALALAVGVNSPFSMPVEFSVAAYRFGHSMIRDTYWHNFNFTNATLGQIFQFNRNPMLPVLSNWVIDFNAFFDTGISVPVNNKARKIDSVLANGLESLPGATGMNAVLAKRNLLRGLMLGLPSGQAMASFFGIVPMTTAQLTSGLPVNEVAILNDSGSVLLSKTPLWYYILREAAVLGGGNQLGPVGGRIIGFTPSLPSLTAGTFTVADLVIFAGVTQP